MKAVQQGSDMAAVFACYEHDLERLRQACEALRAQNDALARAATACGGSPDKRGGAGSGGRVLVDVTEQEGRANSKQCKAGKLAGAVELLCRTRHCTGSVSPFVQCRCISASALLQATDRTCQRCSHGMHVSISACKVFRRACPAPLMALQPRCPSKLSIWSSSCMCGGRVASVDRVHIVRISKGARGVHSSHVLSAPLQGARRWGCRGSSRR